MMTGASLAVDISKDQGGQRTHLEDSVAVEEPLELQLCSPTATSSAAKSISITMRTPGDDIDLALGFLVSEAIISRADDVSSADHCGDADPDSSYRNTIRVELNPGVDIDLERLKRHFYTTSSCGVCGKSSIEALRVSGCSVIDGSFSIDRDQLVKVPDDLLKRQRVFGKTGGLHAAAAFDAHGEIIVAREDVGRHNAVDKVIGALLRMGRLPAGDLGLMVSGRTSFELMQKALVAGMPLLASVSAPSSLAIQLAREYGVTLVGFLRGNDFNVYANGQRIEREL
jgi:FdhD protein